MRQIISVKQTPPSQETKNISTNFIVFYSVLHSVLLFLTFTQTTLSWYCFTPTWYSRYFFRLNSKLSSLRNSILSLTFMYIFQSQGQGMNE